MIVVTGATGSIGRHLVSALQAAGVPFRAMVRDPAAAGLDCPLVHGDFDEPASLAAPYSRTLLRRKRYWRRRLVGAVAEPLRWGPR